MSTEVSKIIRNSIEYKKCVFNGIEWEVPSGPAVEFVDLGLSVKWRNRNIGAETIYDYGDYYAWGETETKTHYDWIDPNDSTQNYKYANDASNKLTKYCPTNKTDYWDGEPAGTPDNKLSLEIMDDVAYQTDNSWRMPTRAEFEALKALPNKWTTINGVNGYVFAKTQAELDGEFNEKTMLFIPASGDKYQDQFNDDGSYCNLWSSSLNAGSPQSAWSLSFDSRGISMGYSYRHSGQTVRPVKEA